MTSKDTVKFSVPLENKFTLFLIQTVDSIYQFNTYFQYIEYTGESKLVKLSFAKQLQDYIDTVKKRITTQIIDKKIIITIPVLFSKNEYEVIELVAKTDEASMIKTAIKIHQYQIKEQDQRIQKCEDYIDDVQGSILVNSDEPLNLVLNKDLVYYFDLENYYRRSGANEHNIKLLFDIFKDQIKMYDGSYFSGEKGINYISFYPIGSGFTQKRYLCQNFTDLNDLLQNFGTRSIAYGNEHMINPSVRNSFYYYLTPNIFKISPKFGIKYISNLENYEYIKYFGIGQCDLSTRQYVSSKQFHSPYNQLMEHIEKDIILAKIMIPSKKINYFRFSHETYDSAIYFEKKKNICLKLAKEHTKVKEIEFPQVATYFIW